MTATEDIGIVHPEVIETQENRPSKRCKFQLSNLISKVKTNQTKFPTDEIEKYDLMKPTDGIQHTSKFLYDPFASVRFCFDRQKNFPALFNFQCVYTKHLRLSVLVKEFFPALKLLVTAHRSNMTADHVDDCSIVRSVHNDTRRPAS